MPEPFYVTTPIYYVNARPHIGHAYTTIVADVLARRHRLLGEPTWFLTGTDEHGQKIERSAAAAGIAPQQFANQVSDSFRSLWERMGITNDQFIRTTSPEHARGVQKLFRTLYERGDIYLSSYTGQYCVAEEMFVEGPPGTIGPDGRPTETVTEENFFFRLSRYQRQLLDVIESGELCITPETRKNEVLSFLRGNPGEDAPRIAAGTPYQDGALKDLSVSRSSFTWGIPVPEDVQADAKTTKQHVVYVWLDALANYITALGYGSDDDAKMREFWPAEVHLVGKEIIRFHCVYWPAFLLAAGLRLPKAVTAHGWLLFEDSKMSKSKGNIVRTETILDAFGKLCPPQPNDAALADDLVARSGMEPFREPTAHERDLFASDVLRYFLLREIPFGQDGGFSFEALVTRYNADLANGYGNLVSRVLTLIHRSLNTEVPTSPVMRDLDRKKLPEWWVSDPLGTQAKFADDLVQDPFVELGYVTIRDGVGQVGLSLDSRLQVHGGKYFYANWENLSAWDFFKVAVDPLIRASAQVDSVQDSSRFLSFILSNIRVVDEFLTVSKPWKLQSSDPGMSVILGVSAEYLRLLTALLYPILPFATANVWRQLGLGDIEEAAKRGELNNLQWGGLKPGTKLGLLGPVFPRAEKGMAQTMSDMEQNRNNTPQVTTQADETAVPVKSKLVDESFASKPAPQESFDPAAPPRTSAIAEANPGAQVAGSAAATTERPATPSHSEAASGIFAAQPAPVPETTPEITIDDFARIDLRVAKVLVCERIPKADKLLRLEVDLGPEMGQRQILSGIAEWYAPEDLVGKRIVVITNLPPRKMRGLVSHGMLLAASAEGGRPALATFADNDELPLGSRLK